MWPTCVIASVFFFFYNIGNWNIAFASMEGNDPTVSEKLPTLSKTAHEKDLELCDYSLSKSQHAVALPEVLVATNPEISFGHVCGLKVSCCLSRDFNSLLSFFETFDVRVDSVYSLASRLDRHPNELLVLVYKPLSDNAFGYELSVNALQSYVGEHIKLLVTSIDNQNVLVRVNTFLNLALGYLTGVMCSMCDPYQQLYVKKSVTSERLTLYLDQEICTDMSNSFLALLQQFMLVQMDSRNIKAIDALMGHYCSHAIDPSSKESKFFRKGKSGCHQMIKDFKSFRNMLNNINGPISTLFGCNDTQSCADLICTGVLHGLSYSWEFLRFNLIEQISKQCTSEIECDPGQLLEYVDYILESDAELMSRGVFTSGARVDNALVELKTLPSLDAVRFGCNGFLSRYSCTRFPDITFASTHIEAIVISSSIAGFFFIFGLVLLYRNFTFRIVKREAPTWLRFESLPFFGKRHNHMD